MAPTPWRGCHRSGRRAVLQIRLSPLPRSPLGSRRPKFRGLDTVALRLEVQGLLVHPEEPGCLALVPPRGVKCQADRLSLRLGGGAVGDLLQGEAHLFSSSAARSHGGADLPRNSRTRERVPAKARTRSQLWPKGSGRAPARVIEVRRRYTGEQTRVTSESRRQLLNGPASMPYCFILRSRVL